MVISSRLSPSPQQRNHINSQTFPSWIITSNIMENLLHYGSSDDQSASTLLLHAPAASSTSSTCATPSASNAAAEAAVAKKKKQSSARKKSRGKKRQDQINADAAHGEYAEFAIEFYLCKKKKWFNGRDRVSVFDLLVWAGYSIPVSFNQHWGALIDNAMGFLTERNDPSTHNLNYQARCARLSAIFVVVNVIDDFLVAFKKWNTEDVIIV